jgi:hypothetical protein
VKCTHHIIKLLYSTLTLISKVQNLTNCKPVFKVKNFVSFNQVLAVLFKGLASLIKSFYLSVVVACDQDANWLRSNLTFRHWIHFRLVVV